MRRVSAPIVALATALGLCACDSGTGSSAPTPEPSRSAGASAACAVASPPVSRDAPYTNVAAGRVKGEVGAVLSGVVPTSQDPWVDATALTEALRRTGLDADVEEAGGDASRFISVARRMLADGVGLLIVDPVDTASGIRVERAATRVGVPVIDYGRLDLGGTASYYVSFDAEDVGRLEAQTMMECLADRGVTDPKVIVMNGGMDVDENAVLMAKGVHDVLDPLVASGKASIAAEASVQGWQTDLAAATFVQALDASGGRVDAVLAADDAIAGAVAGVLRRRGLADSVVVTGQGSGVDGVRAVVTGRQSMTAFANVSVGADAVAQLAAALVSGQAPAARGLTLVPFEDPEDATRHVPSVLLPAQVVTQANVSDVVAEGAVTLTELCRGILARCAAVGVQ